MTTYADFLAAKRARTPHDGIALDPDALHPSLFPHQREAVRWAAERGRAGVFLDTGLGKAQPVDAEVLTSGGWRRMGDLVPGDDVISVDGLPTTVTGVYPQGQRPIVAVTFNDGASVCCDTEHLWTVATDLDISRGIEWRTRTISELVEQGLHAPDGRARWRIPVVAPVEHPAIDLPMDPYVLGVLLGDGTFRRPSIEFCSADPEIAEQVEHRLPPDLKLSLDRTIRTTCHFRIAMRERSGSGGRTNRYVAMAREWGMHGRYAHQKFIPWPYGVAGREQRLDLLRGLMDTDGYVSESGTVQFGTSSPDLAQDVRRLVQSLGGIARTTTKRPTYTHHGERRTGRLHYTLTIAMPAGMEPFALPRKIARCRNRYYDPQRKIESVEPQGTTECVCISVAHPSQLYVTKDYVVTHNTRIQVAWLDAVCRRGDRGLIICPLSIARQTIDEAAELGLEVHYARHHDEVDTHSQRRLWITNYEMQDRFDPFHFHAVVLDESSILKNHTGPTRTALIERWGQVPYRLACTATPAPNDHAELANHAEFLGAMRRVDMLAAYFVHDSMTGWRLKGHAAEPMFRWMSTWALAARKPSDITGNLDDDRPYELPPLNIHAEIVEHHGDTPDGQLFATGLGGVQGRAKVRQETLDDRVDAALDLVAHDGQQWIAWCGLNDEADKLARALGGDAVNLHGSLSSERKVEAIESFKRGDVRVLVTKPSIAGMGLNFQNAARQVFVGLGDSYESYYQAIRRSWRFGQTHPVDVHIVVSDLEAEIVANVRRKERASDQMTERLVRALHHN